MSFTRACSIGLLSAAWLVAGCGSPPAGDGGSPPPDQATAPDDLWMGDDAGDDAGDDGGFDGGDDGSASGDDFAVPSQDLLVSDLSIPDMQEAPVDMAVPMPDLYGVDIFAYPDGNLLPDGFPAEMLQTMPDIHIIPDGLTIPDGGVLDGPPPGPPDFSAGGPITYPVKVGFPMGNLHFIPPMFLIKPGDTVEFDFMTDGHSITGGVNGQANGQWCSPSNFDCQNGPASKAGDVYKHTFMAPGTYSYFCRFHNQGGNGQIIVKP